jgi:aminopeptidase YwaD
MIRVVFVLFLLLPGMTAAQAPPLVPEPVAQAFASEISGETARRNLEAIARQHRMRGSRQFRLAADHVVGQLRAYGIADARVEEFPADGTQWYGTQRARPAWDAEFAELWEMHRSQDGLVPVTRLASFDAMPVTLAQDSESGEVTASLVDVGTGARSSDYAGRDVRGKLVLVSGQPEAAARLAVGERGAAGIISYAQNQATAWSGENDALVRWGHLDTFAPHKTFAFMIPLRQAREFQRRLAQGEDVVLRARVQAGQHPGAYAIATATIPGADPSRRAEEIVFSCHLDHQRPGANDNASGCVTILEVARTFAKLIAEKRIARPARTLRFIWPPEIEGTVTYLNARAEVAGRIKAAVHLDMVGGGPQTKAVFHVTRGPASLPSVVDDIAAAIGAFVNEQTMTFAARGVSRFPLTAPEGGKEPLQAELADFSSGSDHQVYTEGSFRIPAVYMNDWPDRYIHTNLDQPANIDPTKLKRAAFIAATTGWVLANLDSPDAGAVLDIVRPQALHRIARLLARRDQGSAAAFQLWYERALVESMARFGAIPTDVRERADRFLAQLATLAPATPPPDTTGDGAFVFHRNAEPKGPMSVFGYDYLADKLGADKAAGLRIHAVRPERGGGDYAYEVLNLVDGRRTAAEIQAFVSAIYGPITLDVVVEYLRALESIGVLRLGR